jgi:putative nucleotidyltransferase with HDIG domain
MQKQTLRVLLVEDDPEIVRLHERTLAGAAEANFVTQSCSTLAEALNAVSGGPFDAVVLDLGLPDSSGVRNVEALQARSPDLPVVVVSGRGDEGVIFEAMRRGAQEYLIKGPGVHAMLARAILYAVSRKRSEVEIQRTLIQLKRTLRGTVSVLATTLEMKDPYTAGHERRVAALACEIARRLGYDEDALEGVHVAGTLHDIGKIAIPAEILAKPAPLTAIEYELVKTHPKVGHDILAGIEFPWPVADVVHQHHERLDGSGYPQGLRGDAIRREATVLAVADVVEAMSSHRPYRSARGIDLALRELTANRGRLYSCEAVDTCLALFQQEKYSFDTGTSNAQTD